MLSCLRRLTRQPLRISFQVVEAYDARDHRAACHFEGQPAEDCKWHSVMWEENYVDPWQALTQAKNLAGSLVLDSMSQDIIGFFCTLVALKLVATFCNLIAPPFQIQSLKSKMTPSMPKSKKLRIGGIQLPFVAISKWDRCSF